MSSFSSLLPTAFVRETAVSLDGPDSSSLLSIVIGGVLRRILLLRLIGLDPSGVVSAGRLPAFIPLRSEPSIEVARGGELLLAGVPASRAIRLDGVCGEAFFGSLVRPRHQRQAKQSKIPPTNNRWPPRLLPPSRMNERMTGISRILMPSDTSESDTRVIPVQKHSRFRPIRPRCPVCGCRASTGSAKELGLMLQNPSCTRRGSRRGSSSPACAGDRTARRGGR